MSAIDQVSTPIYTSDNTGLIKKPLYCPPPLDETLPMVPCFHNFKSLILLLS